MTIRLEITAEKPEEFMFKAVKTLALMLGRMGHQKTDSPDTGPVVHQEPKAEVIVEAEQPAAAKTDDAFPVSDDVGADVKTAEPEKRRGRPPKAKPAEVQQGEDTSAPETETAPAAPARTELTKEEQDQLTDRIRNVIKAEEDREYARRGVARKASKDEDKSVMAHGTRYTMQLLEEFGARKRSDIPPARYDEFMARSQVYLDGSMKLKAA